MPDEIIKDALERFKDAEDGTSLNREDYLRDVRFARLGDQWPEAVRKLREAEGRPALTINRLPSFIRQVTNEARQNKPGIKVSPVDNGADEDTAEIIQGLVRHIERRSHADVSYDTATDHAVSGGFGFFRIGIEYAHDDSFDLEAVIERIANPLMVHWDPNTTRYDSADWEFAFVSDWLSEDEYEARYPKKSTHSFQGDRRDAVNYWLQGDQIRVAEYWLRESVTRKLLLLSDGRAIRQDVLGKAAQETAEASGFGKMTEDQALTGYLGLMDLQVLREREVEAKVVKRHVINADEVLEEDSWPGSAIPICPVWGDEVIVDGRRHFRSMVADAIGPQQMYNFWRSATTELVALAPRNPWLVEENSLPVDGRERDKWGTANTRSHAYLSYAQGRQRPERMNFASIPTGAMQEAMTAVDDMKATTGIYDASLGAQGNETSGRAILARQREGDISNYHFVDNLNRAIAAAGQILVEIIPAVYGVRQSVRILGEDMREKVVTLTQEDGGSQDEEPAMDGGERLYNLSVGRYDVTVDSGPNYATQREEAREVFLELIRARPELGPILGDLLLERMDFQGADEAAERLRLLLPPQVQQQLGMAPAAPIMPGQGGPMMPGQPDPMQQGGGPMPQQPMPGQPMPPFAAE